MSRRVFITEYVGLSTRLEALAMAFLISDYFGHEVCIDWSELDALNVIGARTCGRGVFGRLDNLKLRGATLHDLLHATKHRNVTLRTHDGPQHLLQKYYLPTARRVKLRPDLIEVIRATLKPYAGRPLVGVHIRRGDFAIVSAGEFDVNAAQWPAAPDWWYEHVMAQIQRRYPDVAFFVSCTGSLESFPGLQKRFDVFDLPTSFPYLYKGADHAARRHPAADLFALACCSVIIGSSCSTFSHYAANMLGEPTTVLVPPARKITAAQPAVCRVDLYGHGAFAWYNACRTGAGATELVDAGNLPVTHGAKLDWL